MSEKFAIFYVTFPGHDEADRIIKSLLDRRLIACANVFAPHRAYYNWKGRVENEPEIAAVLKTRKSYGSIIKGEITKLHPYECPCIVCWDIEDGNAPYMAWLVQETADPQC